MKGRIKKKQKRSPYGKKKRKKENIETEMEGDYDKPTMKMRVIIQHNKESLRVIDMNKSMMGHMMEVISGYVDDGSIPHLPIAEVCVKLSGSEPRCKKCVHLTTLDDCDLLDMPMRELEEMDTWCNIMDRSTNTMTVSPRFILSYRAIVDDSMRMDSIYSSYLRPANVRACVCDVSAPVSTKDLIEGLRRYGEDEKDFEMAGRGSTGDGIQRLYVRIDETHLRLFVKNLIGSEAKYPQTHQSYMRMFSLAMKGDPRSDIMISEGRVGMMLHSALDSTNKYISIQRMSVMYYMAMIGLNRIRAASSSVHGCPLHEAGDKRIQHQTPCRRPIQSTSRQITETSKKKRDGERRTRNRPRRRKESKDDVSAKSTIAKDDHDERHKIMCRQRAWKNMNPIDRAFYIRDILSGSSGESLQRHHEGLKEEGSSKSDEEVEAEDERDRECQMCMEITLPEEFHIYSCTASHRIVCQQCWVKRLSKKYGDLCLVCQI